MQPAAPQPIGLWGRGQEQGSDSELLGKRVLEASHDPLLAHDPGILGKTLFVTSPHSDSGMVTPPRLRVARMLPNVDAESDEYLLALDALLAEPLVVETPGRGPGVRVWKEGLHRLVL